MNNSTAKEVLSQLEEALTMMKVSKPDERSELARRYAVSITELEKAIAYFKTFVVGVSYDNQIGT